MKINKRPRRTLPLSVAIGLATGTALLGVAAGVLAQSPMQLVIYKNTVPTDVRKWNGRLYIPIADVAKAMQWRLTVSGNRIQLTPPVASSPVATTPTPTPIKLAGEVGEELYTGKHRFRVNSVQEVTKYERKYANGMTEKTAVTAEGNDKLVVLDCVLTNATTEREEFCFSRDRWAENTVLLEKSGESLTPFAYDVAADEVNPIGAYALSGATVRFALVFRVPQTWQKKALLYTIVRYGERGMHKGTDVRVNLTP